MSVDAAYVLEQFQQELANVPEEVAHYLEEIKTKDVKLYSLRKRIQHNDSQIQKHIRAHGSLVENPKEGGYATKINADFESAMRLQDEKCELANKLNDLISRHLKKLDNEIKKLQNDGALAPGTDSVVLSSIRAVTMTPSHLQQLKRPATQSTAGAVVSRGTTPDGPLTPAAMQQRMMKKQKVNPGVSALRAPPAAAGSSPLAGMPAAPALEASVGITPGSIGMQFTGAAAADRDRSLQMPGQRSMGPRNGQSRPGGQQKQKLAPHSGEEEEDDEENNDSALYCFCQQVSYGDMVACDNNDCQYEWFHYGCVGLKQPPVGVWYCSATCQEKAQNNKRRK